MAAHVFFMSDGMETPSRDASIVEMRGETYVAACRITRHPVSGSHEIRLWFLGAIRQSQAI